ncbi:collagenase [Peribacillus butanolivorans]|uniref:collagenase n=1 Tax=Peribacillus butanolivorans TaxID=421767 RepID=UPI00207D1282|nr:collagenase [Peribacillus butanolivorans]
MNFFKSVTISFVISLIVLGTLVIVYHFLSRNNTFDLEKLLEREEYHLLDGVKIYNSENDELSNLIINEITNLNKELSSMFGTIKMDVEINIMVFEELEELQKHAELENIGAFFDKNYNLIALVKPDNLVREADEWFFRRDLRHEYTHYYLTKYLSENKITAVPKWFDEGLAEYVAVTMDGVETTDPLEEVINFELLKSREDWATQRRSHTELYPQSHYGIKYIIEDNDLSIIKKIIDDSYKLDFSKSFKRHTNIEINEFHKLIN